MTDVGNYPFLQALDFHQGRQKHVRLVVIHATATGESSGVAEAIQRTWHGDDGRTASAHLIADCDSVVRCVHDDDTAWHAKGANADGIGVEVVGQATQSEAQWLDAFSKAALDRAAKATALECRKFGLPVRRLTVAQVKDGVTKGITCHADVEKAFPSTGHTDPGPHFPWDWFLARVRYYYNPPAPKPAPYHWTHLPLSHGDHNGDVTHLQQRLNTLVHAGLHVDGQFGDDTEHWVIVFQKAHGLTPDGVVGPKTAAALG